MRSTTLARSCAFSSLIAQFGGDYFCQVYNPPFGNMSIRAASWLPSTLTGSSRHADTPLPLTSGDLASRRHFCDIARSRIDFRFRWWRSAHVADITAMTEFGPDSDIGLNS